MTLTLQKYDIFSIFILFYSKKNIPNMYKQIPFKKLHKHYSEIIAIEKKLRMIDSSATLI